VLCDAARSPVSIGEIVCLDPNESCLAGLNHLGQLDLLLGSEQVVLPDGGEVLRDDVHGQAAAFVCQRVRSLPLTP
jgi:hypothetical protein